MVIMMVSETPLLDAKDHAAPSVFQPENMLREARRQKRLVLSPIPKVCLLDPDGDIVRQLLASGKAKLCTGWACYHTQLYEFTYGGTNFGIIGCAVGSAFAVLLAEQAFASGCELLISVTSAGQIVSRGTGPYFILIDRALRDEGTSYHYLPPSRFVMAKPSLAGPALAALEAAGLAVYAGASWTTDAPFRETETAIAAARREGILAVEMEAAALYAFAETKSRDVLCFAHVTNQMAQIEGDFEKGEANGAHDALTLINIVVRALRPDQSAFAESEVRTSKRSHE
jgi:uridine phosphorylase